MGLFSSIRDEFKRAGRSLEKETGRGLGKIEAEAFRHISDITRLTTLGIINPNEIKRDRKQQKKAEKAAKKAQTKQKRAALIEQAELQDELAQRGATAKRGGRLSLLSSGESGSLLA